MSRARALVAACSLLGLVHAGELDLLAALALGNGSRAGVAADAAPGPLPHRNVYALQGDSRSLQVADGAFARAVELLRRSPEFTLLAVVRQQRSNTGTIVSFSHGYNRYLELQSSGRRDEIRLHYVSAGSATARVETFPFRLADGVWHKLALSVSGAQAQLLVDCHPLYRRLIQPPDRNFSQPQLSLWVGQRNSKHSLFKGLIQDVRLISGPHGYLTQCPNLDSECPTCGQFSLLQATVQELTAHIHDLSLKLLATEERINRLEECDCQKSCYSNDTMHPDGASWQKDCNRCSCVHGEITCRPVECERADCKNPIIHPGECCPTCLKQCLLKGTLYEHGDRYAPKECAECVCHDGNMNCKRVDPETACPALPCDLDQQFSVAGECCKFCPGVDYCSMGHSCDENATCMNLNTKYTCKCNMGFQGDGLTCEDVDECLSAGGHYGHHCHANTKCMNVVGSYICQCNPGYARADKFNCVEIDECTIGSHSCSEHARCENTAGSYKCHCLNGYTGNGYECKPICEGGCLNGGQCASPNQCECKPGFIGKYCETDVDECSSGTQLCPPSSDCVNMPGWYYCNCKPGYRSHLAPEPQMSAVCTDIDECSEGLHTCHSTAECRNIDGSYQCSCIHPDCKLSCMQNGNEYLEGSKWVEAGGCRGCTCTQGVLSCAPAPCICARDFNNSSTGVMETGSAPTACCPQCEAQYDCRHQELHHVLFRSGQRWIYQCQTCECLLGEVDCWDLDCPGSVADCCGRPEDLAACGHNSSTHSHCQVAYCATLVSNIACCVHRSVPRSVAAALLAWAWWGAGGGWPAAHRKHRGCRPPRSPREPSLSTLPI